MEEIFEVPRPFSLASISQIVSWWLVFYVCQVLIDGPDVNDNNDIGLFCNDTLYFKCKHVIWNHNAMFISLAHNVHQYGTACFANPK